MKKRGRRKVKEGKNQVRETDKEKEKSEKVKSCCLHARIMPRDRYVNTFESRRRAYLLSNNWDIN